MSQISTQGKVWDVDCRFTQGGMAIAIINFSEYQGKKDGKSVYNSIKIKCFKELAEAAGNDLKQGDDILVMGRLVSESWEKDGVKKYQHVIIADCIGKNIAKFTGKTTEEKSVYSELGKEVFPDESEIPF